MFRAMGIFRAITAAILLIVTVVAFANCQLLTGTWRGVYYGRGPYQGRVPVIIQFKAHGDQLIGHTIGTVPKAFSAPLILGRCNDNRVFLNFYNHQQSNKVKLSFGVIKDGYLFLHVNWENAMIGGHGMMLLAR